MSRQILSPLPGTFYRKPAPDQPDYKEVGDTIAVGDVIGLVEVMKSFNEIKADFGGIWSEMIRVARDFRGQGLGPRLRAHVARHCARAGYARMIGFIDTTNRNSTRALGKVGFVPIGRIFFVRIFGLTLIHHGPTWRLGRWTADRPLEIPIGATHATSPFKGWPAG